MYLLKKAFLGVNDKESSFEKRGFLISNEKHRANLENIIRAFLEGYRIAMKHHKDPKKIVKKIENKFDNHLVGFAFEGSGMSFAVMDVLFPKQHSRLRKFIENELKHHDFIAAVGAGLAIGKAPFGLRKMEKYMRKLDPRMAWCVPDGYAFYKGIFETKKYIDLAQDAPSGFPEYAKNVFDSGLGRAIWWAKCGSPKHIKQTIDAFPKERQAELWSGIGVASTYAGGVEYDYLDELVVFSGDYKVDYLSGIPFSAKMRQKGGNYSEWTEKACQRLLNASIDEVANMTNSLLDETLDETLDKDYLMRFGYDIMRMKMKEAITKQLKTTSDHMIVSN